MVRLVFVVFFFFLPGCSEDLPGVGTDGVNGAFVTSDLSYGGEVVYIPDLQHAAATGAQQHGSTRDVRQGAHPVLMGVRDLLWKEKAGRSRESVREYDLSLQRGNTNTTLVVALLM